MKDSGSSRRLGSLAKIVLAVLIVLRAYNAARILANFIQ